MKYKKKINRKSCFYVNTKTTQCHLNISNTAMQNQQDYLYYKNFLSSWDQ